MRTDENAEHDLVKHKRIPAVFSDEDLLKAKDQLLRIIAEIILEKFIEEKRDEMEGQ